MPLTEPTLFGFFDVDTRDDPIAPGPDYKFRPRVKPVAENLASLLRLGETHGIMMVMRCITICKGRTCRLAIEDGTLTVPMGATPDEVRDVIRDRRGEIVRVEFERRTCGTPEENLRQRAFDVFRVNPGASAAIEELGIGRWIVFGTSMAGCLGAVIDGLIERGEDVTVAADAIWDAPPAVARCAPPELLEAVTRGEPITETHLPNFVSAFLERYRSAGARIRSTREILDEVQSQADVTTLASVEGARP